MYMEYAAGVRNEAPKSPTGGLCRFSEKLVHRVHRFSCLRKILRLKILNDKTVNSFVSLRGKNLNLPKMIMKTHALKSPPVGDLGASFLTPAAYSIYIKQIMRNLKSRNFLYLNSRFYRLVRKFFHAAANRTNSIIMYCFSCVFFI